MSVTREISDMNLDIASAHIATFGEKAVDVFYVTDLTGKKITSSSRESIVRDRLDQGPDSALRTRSSRRESVLSSPTLMLGAAARLRLRKIQRSLASGSTG